MQQPDGSGQERADFKSSEKNKKKRLRTTELKVISEEGKDKVVE